jgi:hypothetical protein
VLLGLIAIVLLTIGAHQPMLFLILGGFALSGPVTWLVGRSATTPAWPGPADRGRAGRVGLTRRRPVGTDEH